MAYELVAREQAEQAIREAHEALSNVAARLNRALANLEPSYERLGGPLVALRDGVTALLSAPTETHERQVGDVRIVLNRY